MMKIMEKHHDLKVCKGIFIGNLKSCESGFLLFFGSSGVQIKTMNMRKDGL